MEKKQINPLMDSVAQIRIHEFESGCEDAYDELMRLMGEAALNALLENLSVDIIQWRSVCSPDTSDVEHAFLAVITDAMDSPINPTDNESLKKTIQATLHWMRLNGMLKE